MYPGMAKTAREEGLPELAEWFETPPGELAATMMIEITESAQIQTVLDGLYGIDSGAHVDLEVGPHRVPGNFEAGHSDEESGKISVGHFVRFPLPPAARRIFRPAEVALVRATLAAATALALAACGGPALTPEAERGRQIYLAQCAQCHATDPTQLGPLGPPVKGSSGELLEAKLLRGTYPPGYKPKRPTGIMPPQPQLAREIPALAAYLE